MNQAKWIYDPKGLTEGMGCWRCSKCQGRNYNIAPIKGIDPMICNGSGFCPNCGARMAQKGSK